METGIVMKSLSSKYHPRQRLASLSVLCILLFETYGHEPLHADKFRSLRKQDNPDACVPIRFICWKLGAKS